jgi:flagellar protein FliO/FliZ
MIGGGMLITASVALLAVLLLVALAARLIRMGGWTPRPQPGKLLALRESVALDPRRRLLLVECGQKRVVLLTGGPQDLVVGWIDP